jgi:hypothetical protein
MTAQVNDMRPGSEWWAAYAGDEGEMAGVSEVLDYLREPGPDDNARWQTTTSKRLGTVERHIAAVRRDAALDTEDVVNVREGVAALVEPVDGSSGVGDGFGFVPYRETLDGEVWCGLDAPSPSEEGAMIA